MVEVIGSKLWLINFYHEQLRKFKKLGLGNRTENDVKVTKRLINATERRLSSLTVVYDARMLPRAIKLRRAKLRQLKKKGQLNEKINGNGTIAASSSKGDSNTRHERSKS